MADLERSPSPLLLRAISKQWTWIALFLLLSSPWNLLLSPWNLLLSIRTWCNSAATAAAAGWKALYAFVLYGGVFGLLSMGAALAVAVPATVIIWITILVLLSFFGKSRQGLFAESHRIIADITGFVFKILLRKVIAAVGTVISFLVLLLLRLSGRGGQNLDL